MFFLLTLFACDHGLNAVAISPIYGWVDGCNAVAITGHGFGDDVSATVGGRALENPVPAQGLLTKGFRLDGTIPAATQPGLVDVVVTSGGTTDTLTGSGGYTYVACPQRAWVDAVDTPAGVHGDVVTFTGCSLDTALRARLVRADGALATAPDGTTPAPTALTSACGTARATFTVPAVTDGDYFVQLLAEDDVVLAGELCVAADSGAMSDSAATESCAPIPFTVGGAR
jgi:hypothetical protein